MKQTLAAALFSLMFFFGSSAFATSTPVNDDTVRPINDQLTKQAGTVGKCHDVRIKLSTDHNPAGQAETKLKFQLIARDGKAYNWWIMITPSSRLVGSFDESGNGTASFYDDEGYFTVSTAFFTYTANAITNFSANGFGICD
jgi:hypothetical protein